MLSLTFTGNASHFVCKKIYSLACLYFKGSFNAVVKFSLKPEGLANNYYLAHTAKCKWPCLDHCSLLWNIDTPGFAECNFFRTLITL